MKTYEEIAAIMSEIDDTLFDELTADTIFDSFSSKEAHARLLSLLTKIGISEEEFWMWYAE